MLLSRSTGRKVVVDGDCRRRVRVAVRGHDPRFAQCRAAELELRDSTAAPVAGRTAALHRHRLLQGHDDRVGGERPDRHRRRRSRAAAGRLGHPGRPAGRPLQRHLHDHGHRPGGPGPPARHLHVELQRGAARSAAAPPPSRCSASAGTRGPARRALIDRLFRAARGCAAADASRCRSASAVADADPDVKSRVRGAAAALPALQPSARLLRSPDPCTAADTA